LSRLSLYLFALALAILGLAVFLYKAYVLGFPLAPKTTARVWNVEARISFLAEDKPVKVSLFIPTRTQRFAVHDEHFISSGYGLVASSEGINRKATWSIRNARGQQSLYYQAVIRTIAGKTSAPESSPPLDKAPSPFEGLRLEAAKSLLEEIRSKSADTPGFVTGMIRRLNKPQPEDNVGLLVGRKPSVTRKVRTAVRLLDQAGIPARMVQGVQLQEEREEFSKKVQILHWLEVYYDRRWHSFDFVEGKTPVPADWLPWWRGTESLVDLQGADKLIVTVSVSPKVEEGIAAAVTRGEITKPLLLKFSLFSLPVNTQAVYRVTLMLPLGAFLVVILRNVVGIKTFGTFMPVLIGLAFRETGLLWGILFFCVVVFVGLSVRFLLEHLKLLVVPRLAAVLMVVVAVLVGLSLISQHLGIHRGLSVSLFPMVILTMTIERMSILWEERGSSEALTAGLGSLLTAVVAFLIMNVKLIEHLLFVFPELLLVLFSANLLVGRYSGYRLMDLFRFRALAQGSD
jgi:hypothetical protein